MVIKERRFISKIYAVFFCLCLVLLSFGLLPQKTIAASITCSTSACLTTALSNAAPGDVITLAAGVTFSGVFVASANGTSANPIILQSDSSNKAILEGPGTSANYNLHMTGDYWIVKNVKITNAKKGIVLDNANYTLIDNVEVYHIGEEAIHYRDGSSFNTLQNSNIYDIGTVNPQFGEGVYVGSDVGKWGSFAKETDHNVIKNNVIGPNVRAESIDIKEGATGTIVEGNTFDGTGISGANAADSFIDIKGNNSIIRNNIGYRNNNPQINDAFQTNEKSPGWGYNNDIYNNVVDMNNTTGYVINVKAGSANACNNTRTPAGNMYLGAVTSYTSCSDITPPAPIKFTIPTANVTASTSDFNLPARAVDGSLSTRWSGEGDGAWIKFDLGSSKTIAFIKIAFYDASKRTFTFDIQTSKDATVWTTHSVGLQNALNNNLQTFDIADSTARYVRIIGHGNTKNAWNSYTEVEVWGL